MVLTWPLHLFYAFARVGYCHGVAGYAAGVIARMQHVCAGEPTERRPRLVSREARRVLHLFDGRAVSWAAHRQRVPDARHNRWSRLLRIGGLRGFLFHARNVCASQVRREAHPVLTTGAAVCRLCDRLLRAHDVEADARPRRCNNEAVQQRDETVTYGDVYIFVLSSTYSSLQSVLHSCAI